MAFDILKSTEYNQGEVITTLKDQIEILFNALNTKAREIAEYTNMGVTNISRLKSGARTPNPNSSTIDKLTDGIILYCKKENKTDVLRAIIKTDSEELKEPLKKWLFPKEKVIDTTSFPSKLNAVMILTDTSNKELAQSINLDASYISRIRSGSRILKPNSPLYEAISHTLFAKAADRNLIDEIKSLIEYSGTNDDESIYYAFKNWLCSFQAEDEHIKKLLQSIDALNLPQKLPFDLSALDLSYSENERYINESGLQEAVLRFLTEVINSEAKEIYLYSDSSIDWMTKDKEYSAKWAYLMFRLVSKGVKIKIIHNIDRKISDMVNAVQSWLPLYMSCCIEPYYTNVKAGKRFSHTMFVCPDVACVSGFNPYGDAHTLYHYYTDKTEIAFGEYQFNALMKKSLPLVHMQKGSGKPNSNAYKQKSEFSNIEISIDAVSVTVTRTSEPKVSFVILNDLLCNSIRAYCTNTYKRLHSSD